MAMKDLVVNTLNDGNVPSIAFSFGPVSVGAAGYTAVKTAVDGGSITVEHVPSLGARGARYRYTHNQFRLGFNSIGGSADKKSLIVHEATHAIFDINRTTMKVKQSEAAAYIAQCMMFYFLNRAALEGGSAAPTFADPILAAAWPIATAAIATPAVPEASLAPLYTAIANNSMYADAEEDEGYDGI